MASHSNENTQHTSAIHGRYGRSHPQRFVFNLVHATAVGCAAWMLLSSSGHPVNQDVLPSFLVHPDEEKSSYLRRLGLVACSTVYFARVAYGNYCLMPRQMGWGEVGFVGPFLLFVHLLFAKAGGARVPGDINENVSSSLVLGGLLYAIGSFLNTGSEYLRNRWKQKKTSKGRLYTGGLFKYSMHINYFGDTVLFSGFALMTTKWWAFFTPAFMTLGFVMEHIPELDKYLAQRYKDEFKEYSNKTAKFIPFVW